MADRHEEWGPRRRVFGPKGGENGRARFSHGPRQLARIGRVDGRRNVPDAETLRPWPTPAMGALLDEGRVELLRMARRFQEDVEVPTIRLALARQRVAYETKRAEQHDPLDRLAGPETTDRSVITVHAMQSAAEVRLETIEEVHRRHAQQVMAETNARLKAYWGANLAARPEVGRLILSDLELPMLQNLADTSAP